MKRILFYIMFMCCYVAAHSQNNITLFSQCEKVIKGQSTVKDFETVVQKIVDDKVYLTNEKNSALFFLKKGDIKCLVAEKKFSFMETNFQYNEFIQDEGTLRSFLEDVYSFIDSDKSKKIDPDINGYLYLDLNKDSRIIECWSDNCSIYILYTTLNNSVATLSLYMKRM